jgi:hypothetical protein
MIKAVILWVHVLCGVGWVGACTTFMLAAAASLGEPDQGSAFALRVAPQINRLCLPMAIAIPITGIANLWFTAQSRGLALPVEFVGIVGVKAGLLAIMVYGLSRAWRFTAPLREGSSRGASGAICKADVRRIMAMYGVISGAGLLALGLGLWLSGS